MEKTLLVKKMLFLSASQKKKKKKLCDSDTWTFRCKSRGSWDVNSHEAPTVVLRGCSLDQSVSITWEPAKYTNYHLSLDLLSQKLWGALTPGLFVY